MIPPSLVQADSQRGQRYCVDRRCPAASISVYNLVVSERPFLLTIVHLSNSVFKRYQLITSNLSK